jgi:hypothetical protein
MAAIIRPTDVAFEDTAMNTNVYKFHLDITQGDGATAVIFYNESGYSRSMFELFFQTSHGSIGWGWMSGQISRYGINTLSSNFDNMGYHNIGYHQSTANAQHNGVSLVRTGTYGNSNARVYGRVIAPAGVYVSVGYGINGTNAINSSKIVSKGV